MIEKVNLHQTPSTLTHVNASHYLGKVNGCEIKILKVNSYFPWHIHEFRDKMILVIKGCFKIYLEDKEVILNENEALIIPRGLNHSAAPDPEAWILLID